MVAEPISPALLLAAYSNGYFPMADSRNAEEVFWFYPEHRGIIPLEKFHLPRSLEKTLKRAPFEITADEDFESVIRACAEPSKERRDTWINDEIIALYTELYRLGYAHSIECWQNDRLVGGLYGVAMGGAFFGESMFSRTSNASKAALAELVRRLRQAGYALLDTQYVNPHLRQFGCIEIKRADYMERLAAALRLTPEEAFH